MCSERRAWTPDPPTGTGEPGCAALSHQVCGSWSGSSRWIIHGGSKEKRPSFLAGPVPGGKAAAGPPPHRASSPPRAGAGRRGSGVSIRWWAAALMRGIRVLTKDPRELPPLPPLEDTVGRLRPAPSKGPRRPGTCSTQAPRLPARVWDVTAHPVRAPGRGVGAAAAQAGAGRREQAEQSNATRETVR